VNIKKGQDGTEEIAGEGCQKGEAPTGLLSVRRFKPFVTYLR
jgi:hypothetical protein